jgi:RNA polymerase sigma factor (TIGR02999 family)
MGEVTGLIERAHAGDRAAGDALFALVYTDLKEVAQRQVRKLSNAPMHTTTLVHEAYFRLAKPEALSMKDRGHFFATAARAMRQLLLDEVRMRGAVKRDHGALVELDALLDQDAATPQADSQVLALDQALTQLSEVDQALAKLVELRFFAGLELTEIVPMLDRSERSLKRDWRKARAFLHAKLSDAVCTLES